MNIKNKIMKYNKYSSYIYVYGLTMQIKVLFVQVKFQNMNVCIPI